jgi:probable HAF family extracellular repeat protein
MIDLTPGSSYVSTAYGINDSGAVVGFYGTSATTNSGFLYADNTFTDLNSLISPTSGWTITGAYGINDSGQIAAIASNGTSTDVLLLTAPLLVPEPPTIALLCSGAVVGLGLRRLSRRIKAADLAAESTAE